MTFEPGQSYWTLDSDQYAEMCSFLEEYGYDLDTDFQLADDGNYYATMSSVSDDELAFMEEWGFNNLFNYKKSTQSTSPV